MSNVNPYLPPTECDANRTVLRLPFRYVPRLVTTLGIAGAAIAAYGLLGTVLNGLDLIRTLSYRDAMKELWLLSILATGIAISLIALRLRKHDQRRFTFPFACIVSAVTIGFIYFEFC